MRESDFLRCIAITEANGDGFTCIVYVLYQNSLIYIGFRESTKKILVILTSSNLLLQINLVFVKMKEAISD